MVPVAPVVLLEVVPGYPVPRADFLIVAKVAPWYPVPRYYSQKSSRGTRYPGQTIAKSYRGTRPPGVTIKSHTVVPGTPVQKSYRGTRSHGTTGH